MTKPFMYTTQEIEKASVLLKPFIVQTPLIRAREIEKIFHLDHHLYLKCENFQITHSFKARGAFLALHLLQNTNGVVTRSSGNFGIAVAKAAKELSIPAHIVLSNKISEYKKKRIEEEGATIYFEETRDAENALVASLAKEKGYALLSPFDHEDVILGQATLGLEVLKELPSMKYFIGPIGGGGLMGGASLAIKQNAPFLKTIGVEPEGAGDYFLSRKERKRVKLGEVHTFCEGLQTPCVGEKTYPLLEKYVDETRLVSDKDILDTMRCLFKNLGLVLEPSGAASAAIFLNKKNSFTGDVVCVLSGGNISYDQFLNLMEDNERDKS